MEAIKYNGIILTQTQGAFLDELNGQPVYQAAAVDAEGNLYHVMWKCYDNYQELIAAGDESDACDWDDYSVVPVE
jgi:hypothetical protein